MFDRCPCCGDELGTGGCTRCTSVRMLCSCGAVLRCGCGRVTIAHDCPNIIRPVYLGPPVSPYDDGWLYTVGRELALAELVSVHACGAKGDGFTDEAAARAAGKTVERWMVDAALGEASKPSTKASPYGVS